MRIAEFTRELRTLVRLWTNLEKGPQDRDGRIASALLAGSEVGRREVETRRVLRDGEVFLSSLPITLRASIWLWLFELLAPNEFPRCKRDDCERPLHSEGNPGPRPKLCSIHGSNAGRQDGFRKRARDA